MSVITLAHCDFAQRFLLYCAEEGVISWHYFNKMVSRVRRHQRRLQGCEGKAMFTSFALADKVARRIGRHDGGYRRPYRCDVCRLHHLAERTSLQRRAEEQVLAKRKTHHAWDDGDLADA